MCGRRSYSSSPNRVDIVWILYCVDWLCVGGVVIMHIAIDAKFKPLPVRYQELTVNTGKEFAPPPLRRWKAKKHVLPGSIIIHVLRTPYEIHSVSPTFTAMVHYSFRHNICSTYYSNYNQSGSRYIVQRPIVSRGLTCNGYSTPGDNLILLQQLLQLCGRHLCLGDLSIIIAVLTRYIGESEIRAEQYIKLL